ncbi:MAG TPA: four helix bundle protein [Flavobacterium sp.]|nr:four helix bundle protein [Flavobacterium sp.]
MIDYKKYKVWEKAHAFVLKTYALTANFPKSEMFNLTSQINRAAVSIPTNIAEGCGRATQKELVRFLYIASGSAHELEYLLLLAADLQLVPPTEAATYSEDIVEVKKMLAALIRKINETESK